MPAPLLWLGAAALGVYAGNKLNKEYLRNQNIVGTFPGESGFNVTPKTGCVVTCGIYEVLDHTGIYVDGKVIELNGNGLIRGVSFERFIQNRSGDNIYVACDANFEPLVSAQAAEVASNQLYSYREYDVLKNNCHKFVAESFTGKPEQVTSFSELNERIFSIFNESIHWHNVRI